MATVVTFSMFPGVQASTNYSEAHLLDMWHDCAAPAPRWKEEMSW